MQQRTKQNNDKLHLLLHYAGGHFHYLADAAYQAVQATPSL